MRSAVLSLHEARPVWAIPAETLLRISAAFPGDWQVIDVRSAADGRGDGVGAVSDEALAAIRGAEVYMGFGLPRPLFLAALHEGDSRLRWAHTATAGVASLLYSEMVESEVILTNSAGIHAPPIAETALAMMLHFARGFDVAVRAQRRRAWAVSAYEPRLGPAREIQGATIGIVGLGGIGIEVAARALALGMHVIAVRRGEAPAPPGVELIRGSDALLELLARSDYIVLSLPATPETRGLIGVREIEAMQPHAVLVNVGRGDAIADEGTLADALRDGRLRGAGLDVFREEPLPSDSPLWDLPNVLITPHVSGTTDRFWARQEELILYNVNCYLSGQPLRNVVDKRRGY